MITRIRTALDRLIARHTQDFPCKVADVYAWRGEKDKPSNGRYEETREFTENDALWPTAVVLSTAASDS